MNTDPHWTTILAALLTPTVAVLGIYIAYKQWRLSQSKLKLELFDRRMKVYEAARRLLTSILTTGKSKDEESFAFLAGTKEAKWLLNPVVATYLEKELYFKAIDLARLQSEVEGLPPGDERTRNVQSQGAIKQWFIAQYEALDSHFAPFLALSH